MKNNIISALFIPLFFLLVIYPVLALLGHVNGAGILKTFHDILFWQSVKNTIGAAFIASGLCLVMAIGFGYYHLFAKDSYLYRILYRIANFINDLPAALPHTVAGLALLLAFGRNVLGFVSDTGLAFTKVSVVLAMFFVSYPLAARAISAGVDKIEPEVIDVARTLGDTPGKVYLRIVIPSLRTAMFSSFGLAFARSISEFAAVLMFGGNVPGDTQVLASYVFTKVEEGEIDMAVTASAFCILLSLLIVGFLNLINKRGKINA